MALPFIVDDIESVAEPFREHYAERNDGKFRLNVEGFEALAGQWTARIESLTAERDAARESESFALLDATLTAALTRAGATRLGHELVTQLLRKRVHLDTQDDGKRAVRFLKADERTPMTGTGQGGAATWNDLMTEARQLYPSMFRD